MKKYIFSTILGLTAFSLVGGAVALASSGNGFGSDRMMETKAEVFGMTVEELETARETMDFEEIALQQGVDIDAMHEQMKAKAIERWQDRGLSEEEISERIAKRDAMVASGEGPHSGEMGFGQRSGSMDGKGAGNCNLENQ
ncbi:hypothetical protein KKI23_03785 [Patescibacteria group bacterium]|nr:hypothetical protein [Patescibacteria group bacterium]